jgi:hypothetical protein
MYGFAIFYALCLVLNWWFYLRSGFRDQEPVIHKQCFIFYSFSRLSDKPYSPISFILFVTKDTHHESFSGSTEAISPAPKSRFRVSTDVTTGEDRTWEDAYRDRWAHDKIVRSARTA